MQKKPENSITGSSFFCCVVCFAFFWLSFGCASNPADIKREIQIPEEAKQLPPPNPPPELKMPDFVPVTEDISPLNTRLINISVRNSPLGDVLLVIAEASSLNLVLESGVVPETPITMTLKDVRVSDALDTVCNAVNYFYTIKENMLLIKAIDTKIFELGHPAITQTYSTAVGGDILSGAVSTTGASGNIKGNISQSVSGDTTAYNFWDAIEQSISSILGVSEASAGTAALRQSAVINRLTGTIFVTAAKSNLERVEKFIMTVKKILSRQVIIEARIIEVQLSDNLKYGIDWSFLGRDLNLGSIDINASGFSSIVDATQPVFGISTILQDDFQVVLNALQQQGEVRTLSNPRINIMNGQTSLLSVGTAQNFISKVETTTTSTGTTGITTFTITTGNVLSGLMLGIIPFINMEGEVSMTITPIVSDLVNLEKVSVGGGTQQTEISLPTVDLRELSTTVKVKDGEMVIIGGLISKKETLNENKIPILGNIPIIGNLFKSISKEEIRRELVILLKPTVVSR